MLHSAVTGKFFGGMAPVNLPNEVFLLIAHQLPDQASLSKLMQTDWTRYQLLWDYLYDRVPGNEKNRVLVWAAERGHEKVVRAMLQRGGEYYSLKRSRLDHGLVEPGPRLWLDSAIAGAAGNGHASILRLLLKRQSGALQMPFPKRDAPLARAAAHGHAEAVSILLENSAEIQSKLTTEQTVRESREDSLIFSFALNEALRRGDEEIANLLLADDRIDLDSESLCAAASGGNERLVDLCLRQGPAWRPGTGFESPLGAAARRGHQNAFLKIAGLKDVDLNMRDEPGRTPLAVAAEHGQNGIAEILLGSPGVDVDPRDKSGQTPLHHAARRGNTVLVRKLLETGAVDVDNRRSDIYIPLISAASFGQVEVVKQLLEAGADPDRPNDRGRTPLATAALSGADQVVEVLLATGRVNPDSRDSAHMTPLMHAAGSGRFLSKPDNFVRTRAFEVETEKVIIPLLKGEQPPALNLQGLFPKPDIDRDISTRGALSVMKQLLSLDQVDPNARDRQGRTALSYAAEMHEVDAIRVLMEDGRVDVDCADNDGWTPMTWMQKKVKSGLWSQDWEAYLGI